jgi:hypothetical protein
LCVGASFGLATLCPASKSGARSSVVRPMVTTLCKFSQTWAEPGLGHLALTDHGAVRGTHDWYALSEADDEVVVRIDVDMLDGERDAARDPPQRGVGYIAEVAIGPTVQDEVEGLTVPQVFPTETAIRE